jgi:hypothetical protein
MRDQLGIGGSDRTVVCISTEHVKHICKSNV